MLLVSARERRASPRGPPRAWHPLSGDVEVQMRVLVIEDNPKVGKVIRKGLGEHGFVAEVTRSGRDGERLARSNAYDAIILDLMLPDHEGVVLCHNLRHDGLSTPILMLTALSETQDKVGGLNAGADDYLTKPFEFEELLARVRALLRRGSASEAHSLEFEDLCMDLSRQCVTRAGETIELKRKEFALLEYFMRNPHRVLTRSAIGEHVWGAEVNPDSNVIDVYISNLRRKVDKPFDRPLIHTVIGSGYRFGSD